MQRQSDNGSAVVQNKHFWEVRYTLWTVFFFVLVVYGNSLFCGFVSDDHSLVIKKQGFFSHPENAIKLLVSSDAPLGEQNPYYRPVNTLSYMLDHYLWGLDPFWYHLENVLLHALASVLFYLLLAAVFKDRRLAFFAALLFAVYPVNTEAVDFISARNTLFCAVFSIAALLFLAQGKRGLPLLAYFLALLSKEPAVVLPLFLLSFSLTSKEESLKIKKGMLAGFFAVTAVYFAIRRLVLGAFTSKAGISLSLSRLKLMAAVYFEHFRLMLFPFRLNAYYTPAWLSFDWYKAAGAAIGVLLLFYFSLSKKSPVAVRAGAQWIFWGLLPVSNIVKIPSASMAERYQYTILPGFVLILGYMIGNLSKKRAVAGTLAMAALSLALGARTFKRNFIWENDLSLCKSMIGSDPGNVLALNNLGVIYKDNGQLERAAILFKKAIQTDPTYSESHMNLGILYMRAGQLYAAKQAIETAIAFNPD